MGSHLAFVILVYLHRPITLYATKLLIAALESILHGYNNPSELPLSGTIGIPSLSLYLVCSRHGEILSRNRLVRRAI
jgi:hypothetical protein